MEGDIISCSSEGPGQVGEMGQLGPPSQICRTALVDFLCLLPMHQLLFQKLLRTNIF